ncbi:NAD(P)H-binding protein [Streptomyces sp. SID3343]|uniref:NAD(P)-dependent oxidoreductase n=1 Tax=Streptomyces sp. SID3343 TaxID=2690260 RepID=UPI0013693999|nr:NAD(P)H-binding protein [Streptomyces sp. SID3343]MYW03879.1 NAD(P)H-binding protein [Streptomyces sp. SID3343]
MAKIALFGANGGIGVHILREALRRGHDVTAVVRDPAKLAAEEHDRLAVLTGDVLDPRSVATAAAGHDALVSAVGGGYTDGAAHAALVVGAAASLAEGLRSLGPAAPGLYVVGGAGSLRTADGRQVWDADGLPELALQVMRGQGDALEYFRSVADVDWTYLSPAADIGPGERTGAYRTGLDDLVTAADGTSRISVADYAVAMLDEIEQPRHLGKRFTVAY